MARVPMRWAVLASLLLLAGCEMLGGTREPIEPVTATILPAVPEPAPERLEEVALPALDLVQGPGLVIEVPVMDEPDLLVRIRRQLELPRSADPAVLRELEWFRAHPEYLARVFERSGRYLYHIVEALEQRDMPLDLALLPVVESAFDPFAYSHGRASGLWQIIPGTGRRLGLKQNWWYDGRRDVLDSTRAALDYLEALNAQFDGDWLLAVAGYNSGEGHVARALRRARAEPGQAPDFWQIRRHLPAETRTYVPRLLALATLMADPAANGIEVAPIPNAPYFASVETGGQIDLALAAELAGIGTDELYHLNPGINRWATDPDGPHRLLVPKDAAPALDTALASLGEHERVQWSRHRIREGETLAAIARQFDTTPAVLRDVNRINGHMIRAGDYLMIPRAVRSSDAYRLTTDARAERQRNVPRAGQQQAHVVKAGETLWTIAQRYGVDLRDLARWNSMAPGDVLSVGRRLVVWTQAPNVPAESQSARVRRVTYQVRRGDSLSSIASRFRVQVAELLQWNSLAADRYLQPGQRLVMYVDVTNQST